MARKDLIPCTHFVNKTKEDTMRNGYLALSLLVSGILTCPSNLYAQSQGTWDLTLLTTPSDGTLNPIVGYFFLDNAELAVSAGYSSISFGDDLDGDVDSLSAEVDFLYNAHVNPNLAFVPLVGVGTLREKIESDLVDTEENFVYFLLGGGVRYFITERGAVALFVIYQNVTIDLEEDSTSLDGDATVFAVQFGYSLFLP